MGIDELVAQAVTLHASDIHLSCGLSPRFRVDGSLVDAGGTPLTEADCRELARELAGHRFDEIERVGELDLARTIDGRRCRINCYKASDRLSSAIRLLSDTIPVLSDLGLPPAAFQLPRLPRGIVLVTGETGSGKSTTLAALLDHINHNRPDHIITLEDPIEYIYTPDRCVIDQREIGRDTASYAAGLRAALREDPDVILIGEMRDQATIETALTAAETGHLVFATLHTNSAATAVDRIVDVFPAGKQQQIRMQLSTTLMAVLAQQLLPRADGHGRVLACELMVVNSAIRNLIREGKTPQIQNAVATDRKSVV